MEAASTLPLESAAPGRATRFIRWLGSPSVVLFLALFASQAGVLVLSPVLPEVAEDFHVSISLAGQLPILAVSLAAVVALVVARSLGRFEDRKLLALGLSLLAFGSLTSAAAPTFSTLALAQIPVWAGVAILMSTGVSAAAKWTTEGERTRVVAHALAGPPAAWIVGMPLVGLAGEASWRLAFLVLPVPAALLAGLALAARPPDRVSGARGPLPLAALLRRQSVRRWTLAELLANSAWAGTLVFSGALLTEVHGTSSLTAGVSLALVAIAFLLGNMWRGRRDSRRVRDSMLAWTAAAGVGVGLLWAVTPDLFTTLVLFSLTAFAVAARTVSGTAYGFEVSREHRAAVGAIRTATSQIGYLIGSLAGGVALAVGGFDALALAYGGLFLAALAPYVCLRRRCRLRGSLLAAEAY
jgi:MFS transporter, DHA1 family, inner membrane transport protein